MRRNKIKTLPAIVNLLFKLLAIGCAVLFVIATLLALLLLGVDQQLLGSGVYKSALAEQRIYDRLPALAAEQLMRSMVYNQCAENPDKAECKAEGSKLSQNPLAPIFASTSPEHQVCFKQAIGEQALAMLAAGKRQPTGDEIIRIQPCLRQLGIPADVKFREGGAPLFVWMLNQSDWEAILSAALPVAWLQTQTESVLDQLFAYLDSKANVIKLSLVELKENVRGEKGMALLLRMVRALPPCTNEQLGQLARIGFSTGLEDVLVCRPPEEIIALATPQAQAALNEAIGKIPDEVDLVQVLNGQANTGDRTTPASPIGNNPLEAFRRVRLLVRLSWLVPLALLLPVTLFGVRSRKGWLRWWGIPLLIVGIIGVGLALTAWLGMDGWMTTGVSKMVDSMLTPSIAQLCWDAGRSIARPFVMWYGVAVGIIGLLGLALFAVSFFIKPNRQPV